MIRAPLKRWLVPSLADCLFAALFLWLLLFTLSSADVGLLQDSNTGNHIRTGDYILEHKAVPRTDIYSFSKPGQPWFAWEWLSDVLFAWLHRTAGLKGLILLAATLIAAANLVLFRYMLWRGANILVALVVLHVAIGASSIHFLARPHLFTLLFMTMALWLLDRDREQPTAWVWALIPLTALWVNLHGGFVALLASLAAVVAGSALEGNRVALRRYAALALACLAASLANPYGFREHLHIARYLRQKWIPELVQEFQAPRFQSAEGRYFEVLLVTGLAVAALLLARRRFASALLVLGWAHAALTSVRHVPLFAIAAAPPVAAEITRLWRLPQLLEKLAADHAPQFRRVSLWPLALLAGLAFAGLGLEWPQDFPASRFPLALAAKHADLIAGNRVFTTDAWADYLTYRFYPRQRVFVDGRSDFFGREVFEDYLRTLKGHYGWDGVLQRYDVRVVLAPSESALASLLRTRPDWRLVEDTGDAALLARR